MLKNIQVEDLRLGMHIHESCGSWMEHPFWGTHFVIDDPEDIRRVADPARRTRSSAARRGEVGHQGF